MSLSVPDNTDSKNWQDRFTARNAQDADARRIDSIALVYILAVLVSSLYATGYIWFYQGPALLHWRGPNAILIGWLVVIIALVILSVIAFSLLFRTAVVFLVTLYHQPDEADPAARIWLRFLGVPPVPPPLNNLLHYPFAIVRDGEVASRKWITWLGGPAKLVIFDGNALYVERGNVFSRIIGPAGHLPFLDATETVKAVVDLHPQVIDKPGEVKAWTKDGIHIQMDVRLECQIGLEGMTEATSKGLLYPYGPDSVRKAIETMAVRYDGEKKRLVESDWADGVWGQVQGMLATYVFSHTVDELFLAESGPDQILSQEVTAKWIEDMNRRLFRFGTRLNSLQITNIAPVSPAVNSQRVKAWEAKKQSATAVSRGEAKAYGILTNEKARAEAERDLIDAIAEGLRGTDPSRYYEQLVLSLSGILDQSLKDTELTPYIASETLESFKKLRELLRLP